MSDNIKYVVLDVPMAGEEIFLFPVTLNHKDFVKALGYKVVSAGFVGHNPETKCGFYCYGESMTLGLKSRPKEDQFLLDFMFRKPY
jgi:hypothetical protein